jgi:hypothetical protein
MGDFEELRARVALLEARLARLEMQDQRPVVGRDSYTHSRDDYSGPYGCSGGQFGGKDGR